jgi:sugar phosphate isomerase/epimerase
MSTVTAEPLWSVFTKPWSELDADALGPLVAGLGFAGAEVPVRDTAFVTPAGAERLLPGFVARMREHGVTVISIAADLAEPTFAACSAAGVPLIRIMAALGPDGYRASVRRLRAELEAAAPLAERYGVQVGIQPHHGRFVPSVLGVLDLIDGLPEHFTVVWDAAHDALAGDDPAVTLELAGERLSVVNLKNAVYAPAERRPGSVGGAWKPWFVQAEDGLSDWAAVLAQVRRQAFTGPVCLTGQYSDPSVPVEKRLEADLRTARAAYAG